ncbi:hypothetical protein cyc_00947 [Cyclospora cayetanensis]|uniref:Uncharacterized protein n=1 Tax=Cyclospora cayetanensis TaxID=88456 RepID=A0A1D3D956_9EIME|nr:hypothetical protein cyc_00947 [Cyclospora cayetanensis]
MQAETGNGGVLAPLHADALDPAEEMSDAEIRSSRSGSRWPHHMSPSLTQTADFGRLQDDSSRTSSPASLVKAAAADTAVQLALLVSPVPSFGSSGKLLLSPPSAAARTVAEALGRLRKQNDALAAEMRQREAVSTRQQQQQQQKTPRTLQSGSLFRRSSVGGSQQQILRREALDLARQYEAKALLRSEVAMLNDTLAKEKRERSNAEAASALQLKCCEKAAAELRATKEEASAGAISLSASSGVVTLRLQEQLHPLKLGERCDDPRLLMRCDKALQGMQRQTLHQLIKSCCVAFRCLPASLSEVAALHQQGESMQQQLSQVSSKFFRKGIKKEMHAFARAKEAGDASSAARKCTAFGCGACEDPEEATQATGCTRNRSSRLLQQLAAAEVDFHRRHVSWACGVCLQLSNYTTLQRLVVEREVVRLLDQQKQHAEMLQQQQRLIVQQQAIILSSNTLVTPSAVAAANAQLAAAEAAVAAQEQVQAPSATSQQLQQQQQQQPQQQQQQQPQQQLQQQPSSAAAASKETVARVLGELLQSVIQG